MTVSSLTSLLHFPSYLFSKMTCCRYYRSRLFSPHLLIRDADFLSNSYILISYSRFSELGLSLSRLRRKPTTHEFHDYSKISKYSWVFTLIDGYSAILLKKINNLRPTLPLCRITFIQFTFTRFYVPYLLRYRQAQNKYTIYSHLRIFIFTLSHWVDSTQLLYSQFVAANCKKTRSE